MKPTILSLCVTGEQAFRDEDFEDALEWYELACQGTVYGHETDATQPLVAGRFERLAELRAMHPWRKVHRLSSPSPGHLLAVMTCLARNEGRVAPSMMDQVARWRGVSDFFTDGLTGPLVGQAQMFFAVLRWAARQQPFTYLTLLEDDIVLAKNALDYIATTKVDNDVAFVSWFSPGTCTIPRTLPLLWCIEAKDYMFNQALTFPAHTVCRILESPAIRNWPEKHGADRIYRDVFPDQYVAVHYPNIVQHIGGAESLVGNNSHGIRTSPTFIGEVADALALIR